MVECPRVQSPVPKQEGDHSGQPSTAPTKRGGRDIQEDPGSTTRVVGVPRQGAGCSRATPQCPRAPPGAPGDPVLGTSEGRRAFRSSPPPCHLLDISRVAPGAPGRRAHPVQRLVPALSTKQTHGGSSQCFIGGSLRRGQRRAGGVAGARPCARLCPPSPGLAPEGAVAEGTCSGCPRAPGTVMSTRGEVGPGQLARDQASDTGGPVCASLGLGGLTWGGARARAS